MIIDDENSLKSWIVKEVASLTDADADRLAMYVIALLKKPLSDEDLVELCSEKLDVFLQAHTKEFVERLFECLKTDAYLPEGANTSAIDELELSDPSDPEEPEDESAGAKATETKSSVNDQPEDRKSTERDVGVSDSKAHGMTSAERVIGGNGLSARVTRRRISPPPSDSRQPRGGANAQQRFSPSRNRRANPLSSSRRSPPPRGRSERYHRRRSYSRSRSRSRSPHREKRRDEHDGSTRRRCRDFHEKGFCMRGDKCNYDHGPDPVVIENAALEKIVSRTAASAVVPPVTTSTLYSPSNPPPPGVNDGYAAEALVGGADGGIGKIIDFSVPPPPLPSHLAPTAAIVPGIVPTAYPPIVASSSSALVTVVPNMQNVVAPAYNAHPAGVGVAPTTMAAGQAVSNSTFVPYGGNAYAPRGAGGFGRRGGRGRFKPYGAPLVNPALCSLLVKKIPPEQNKIVLLDQHFGKFGQITNLHVQYEGQPDTALVTFKSRREALNAYKSTEPIFNNRFIKVFWQTQPEGNENGTASVAPVVVDTILQQTPQPTVLPDGSGVVTQTDGPLNVVKTEVASAPDCLAAVNTETADDTNPSLPSAPPNMGPKKGIYNARAAAAAKKKVAAEENLKKLREIHRLKMELYQKQIEQQKELLQRIQSTDDKELKKKILELVKKRDESIKSAKADLESLSAKIAAY